MTEMSEVDQTLVVRKSTVITVTAADRNAPDWVGFSMVARFPNGGGKQDKDDLVFDKQAGEFDLEFRLVDKSSLNLGFIPCFKETMWVEVGQTCPPGGPGDGNGAISPISWSKTELVVNNRNAVGETLTFALRFTGNASSGGFPPYVYDPRIINGGV